MKKATQELLGIFSQTLPFFLVRVILLTIFNILSLIGLALLLILFQNIGLHDAFLTALILAASAGIFWFVAIFFQTRILLRYRASFLAYTTRFIRLQGNVDMNNPQIKTGLSLVKGKCQNMTGLGRMFLQAKKNLIKLLHSIITHEKPSLFSRILIRTGRPYLEGSLMGFCFDRENEGFNDSLHLSSAFFWQEAGRLIPHTKRLGWSNIFGFVICLIIMLIPLAFLFLHFSAPLSLAIGLALFQAYILKQAFIFPFIQLSMSLHYQRAIQDKSLSPDTQKAIQPLLAD